MHPTVFTRLLAVLLTGWAFTSAHAQLSDSLIGPEHPAIGYGIRPATDPVARLNERLQAGQIHLRFDSRGGHLRSLLEALGIPVESQLAVFSRNSLQAHLIGPRNPRTIFFNDSVIVAWMRGGFIEVAAHDVQQGAVFYRLTQGGLSGSTQLRRDDSCIRCHYSTTTVGVPGFLVRSVPGGADGSIMPWLGSYVTDHRSPIEERWAGWYVTGRAAGRHLGNAPVSDWTTKELRVADANLNLETVANRFDTKEYLTPHSDIVALMVFDHQMRMMNLLTRIGWEVRVAEHERRSALAGRQLRVAAVELVDYLLFVDESRVAGVRGTSGFTEKFSALGPRDRKGRSLRDLDLERRLLRYPCSYMIYSEAFDALPTAAKDVIYRRMWEVLSGDERGARYRRLSAADRQAVLEILRDTKKGLPDYYSAISQSP